MLKGVSERIVPGQGDSIVAEASLKFETLTVPPEDNLGGL